MWIGLWCHLDFGSHTRVCLSRKHKLPINQMTHRLHTVWGDMYTHLYIYIVIYIYPFLRFMHSLEAVKNTKKNKTKLKTNEEYHTLSDKDTSISDILSIPHKIISAVHVFI